MAIQISGTTVIDNSRDIINSTLNSLNYPTSDGSAGQILRTDGSSNIGFSTTSAAGGGTDEVFQLNSMICTTDYTLPDGFSALSAGPITVNSGVTITVGAGENWVIL